MNEGKSIAEWLNAADLINKSALCKKINIDRANLDKYLKIGEIPGKYCDLISSVIAQYGFKRDNKPVVEAERVNTRQKVLSKGFKAVPLATEGILELAKQVSTEIDALSEEEFEKRVLNAPSCKIQPIGLSKSQLAVWRKNNK